MIKRFSQIETLRPGRIGFLTLLEGIMTTACGWGLLGLSLWSLLQAVLPDPPAWTFAAWAQYCGTIGLAYVAGFLAFMLPSGVGVREYFLRQLLGFAGPEKLLAAAVLLLRLVWTTAELILAGLVFFLKSREKVRSPDSI
jgi:uncharacterized membrane protein YbhN (UPF0104 family)